MLSISPIHCFLFRSIYFSLLFSITIVNEINEALGQNFATPDDLDEADLDAELEMLGDELEELEEEEATPSYLMPATPNDTPGLKDQEEKEAVDDFGLPSAPVRN